jgi:hypothetical protein
VVKNGEPNKQKVLEIVTAEIQRKNADRTEHRPNSLRLFSANSAVTLRSPRLKAFAHEFVTLLPEPVIKSRELRCDQLRNNLQTEVLA